MPITSNLNMLKQRAMRTAQITAVSAISCIAPAVADAGTVSIEMSVIGNITTFTGSGNLHLSSYQNTTIQRQSNTATVFSGPSSNGGITTILNEIPELGFSGVQYTTNAAASFFFSDSGIGASRTGGASGDFFTFSSRTGGGTTFSVAQGYNDGESIDFLMTISDLSFDLSDLNFGTVFDDGTNSVNLVQGTIQPITTPAPVPLPASGFALLAAMAGLGLGAMHKRRSSKRG